VVLPAGGEFTVNEQFRLVTSAATDFELKLDGVVHQTALGATGEIDIWIIGVNVSASSATINAIFALGRLKATPAEFGIDAHRR